MRKSLSDVLSRPLWGPAWKRWKDLEPASARGFFSPGQWVTSGIADSAALWCIANALRIRDATTDSTMATSFFVHQVADILSVNIWKCRCLVVVRCGRSIMAARIQIVSRSLMVMSPWFTRVLMSSGSSILHTVGANSLENHTTHSPWDVEASTIAIADGSARTNSITCVGLSVRSASRRSMSCMAAYKSKSFFLTFWTCEAAANAL